MEPVPATVYLALVLLPSTSVAAALTYQGLYLVFRSAVLESGIGANVTSSSVMRCLALCQRTPGCRGVSRHVTGSKTCRLHDTTVLSPDATLRADLDWMYYELSQGAEETSPWQLVFRATAGIGKSVLAVWDKVGHHDVLTTVPPGCLTTNGQLFCDRHFRSSRLDNWQNIEKVRLTMHNNGTKVVDMMFDGAGSDYRTWFSKSRVLSSPWTDLTSNAVSNFDSITGDENLGRRFFLSKSYGICLSDAGWLLVKDVYVVASCDYERWSGDPPVFTYSTLTTSASFASDSAHADVMAVYVNVATQGMIQGEPVQMDPPLPPPP